MILSYVRALVRNTHDADELFQEIGVRILELDQLPCDEDKFPAYCRGIAKNVILHYWRSQRRSKLVPNSELVDLFDLAYTEAEARDDLSGLRTSALGECLELLPEEKRQVLGLRFADGLRSDQIAAATDRTTEAVRKELSRLYAQLQQCIKKRLAWEESHVLS